MDARLMDFARDYTTRFAVPPRYVDEIFAALKPSQFDKSPCKRQDLGILNIRTTDGRTIHVELFDADGLGAFAAGPTHQSRAYYRGGNSAQLRDVLRAAQSAAKKSAVSKTASNQ